MTITNNNTHNNEVQFEKLQIAVLLNLQIAGFITNTTLLLLSIYRRRHYLLLNLAISNYIAVIILTLQIITLTSSQPQSINGAHYMRCDVLLSVTELWWITQNYTLVAISYERYRNVVARQHRGSYDSTCLYITCIWLFAIVVVLILVFSSWITMEYDKNVLRCRKTWEKDDVMLIYSFFSFWIPGFFLTYFRVYMFYESYKKRHSKSRPYSQAANLQRSWSLSSLASLRDLRTAIHGQIRRLSRSESLPASLDWEQNASSSLSSSGRTSRRDGSDYSSVYRKRKRSLSSTGLKPLITTLLILVPYLLASAPETALTYIYSAEKTNQQIDWMNNFKYLLVAYFPVILCSTDKEVKKGLRKLYRRLQCWRSGRISPVDNIDYNDYRENIMRRDSRRSSMMSRMNSASVIAAEDPMLATAVIPYNRNDSPKKANSPVSGLSQSDDKKRTSIITVAPYTGKDSPETSESSAGFSSSMNGKKRESIITVAPYSGTDSPDTNNSLVGCSSSLSGKERARSITVIPYKGKESPDRGTTFFINSPINTPVL